MYFSVENLKTLCKYKINKFLILKSAYLLQKFIEYLLQTLIPADGAGMVCTLYTVYTKFGRKQLRTLSVTARQGYGGSTHGYVGSLWVGW